MRGNGAFRDGVPIRASNVEHADRGLGGRARPAGPRPGFRGSSSARSGALALVLCDVAAGGLDGSLDAGPYHAPWDYLGGYLACVEAGAVVRDANGADLVTADPDRAPAADRGRRPPQLADALMRSASAMSSISTSTHCSSPPTRRPAPAARSCARHFGSPPDVREKAPGDWVSAADLASETAVREVLERETGLPVFGEEVGGDRADTGWLVDPLDGTANFVHGLEAVGVSVGLIVDGEPVVGVVHAPLLDRGPTAARKGGGAFRDERRIHVSDRRPEQAIVATGFPFRRKELLPVSTSPRSRPLCTGSRTSAGSGAPASTSAGPPKACSTATSSSGSGPGTWPRAD